MSILIISPNFNISCGVSRHVFDLLKVLKENNQKVFFITNGGDRIDKLKEIEITPAIFNFTTGSKNIFTLFKAFFKLRKFCLLNEISIIHTHHRYPELLAYLVSKTMKIKTISTVHSFVNGSKLISFKSEKLIAVSNAVKSHLVNKYNIRESKIIQIYNFVEFPEIDENSSPFLQTIPSLTKSNRIILFVGRIGYIKGCDILIQSFLIISEKYPDIYLVLIGNIENEEFNEILLKNKRILHIPPVNNAFEYINSADIVVLPSRIDPFPYVMLESGLFAKPFIGGNTGGISEFIEHKINGYLVKPGDVESLEEGIVWMLEKSDKANEMGKSLNEKVMKLNGKNEYCEKLKEIYYE